MDDQPVIRLDPERLQSEKPEFADDAEETGFAEMTPDDASEADDKAFGETDLGSVPPAR